MLVAQPLLLAGSASGTPVFNGTIHQIVIITRLKGGINSRNKFQVIFSLGIFCDG